MQDRKQPHQQPLQPPSHSTTIKTLEEWKAHWKAQGQEWRTEPEISILRQAELAKRRAITPNEKKDIYPFGGVRLNRADVEWLLATHENGRGPVIWSDESQREHTGLDLRGADLSGDKTQFTNLTHLPLSRLIGSHYVPLLDENQETQAYIHLERANLAHTHLEGANLTQAHLEGANLTDTHLESADLTNAHLEGANLIYAHFEGANLTNAHLESANLTNAHLEGANLIYAHFEGANLTKSYLKGADLSNTHLERANLTNTNLESTRLSETHLERANLTNANLERANLTNANLERANLTNAHFEGANLTDIRLTDKNHIGPFMADIHWGDTNLALADWSPITLLSEEYQAKQKKNDTRYIEAKATYLSQYKIAVRANRQLAVALQGQGLNEDAARFAYRAQTLQKEVFWFQMTQDYLLLRTRIPYLGSWLFSWFMFLIAGYGYRFGRTFVTYLAVISGFATMYYFYGANDLDAHNKPGPHHLSWYEALIVSMTAFHGRGFFVGTFSPGDPQALVAAIEAFLGLLIEVIFIATLTRRLFTQ